MICAMWVIFAFENLSVVLYISSARVSLSADDLVSWPKSGFHEIHYEICLGGKKSEVSLKIALATKRAEISLRSAEESVKYAK